MRHCSYGRMPAASVVRPPRRRPAPAGRAPRRRDQGRPRRGRPPRRRPSRRSRLAVGPGHRGLPHGRAPARRGPEREDRGPGALRRAQPLRRRLLLRQRARPHLGQHHGPRQRRRRWRLRDVRRIPRRRHVERRRRPGPPRSLPGQAQRLRLLRQSPRRPRRGPGLRGRLQPQLGRHLGGQEPPRSPTAGRPRSASPSRPSPSGPG